MEPKLSSYACVKIPYLKKKILGKSIRLPNFIGIGIRVFTFSTYDHAFLYIGDNQIVEAQPSGAIEDSIDKYAGYEMVWSDDDLTDEQRQEIATEAKALVGTPYGFLDLVYLGLATLGLKFQFILKRVEREDRLICSQLVALVGDRTGVQSWLCNKANACLVTPANLAKRLK